MPDQPEQAPVVRWTTEEARTLADIISVLDDLTFVINACERLLHLETDEDADPVVVRALWNAALVAYARCWSTGVRSGISTDVFDGLEGDPLGLHEYLKSMRDKHIAHAVNPFEDVAIGLVLSPVGQADRSVVGVGHLLRKLVSFDHDGTANFGTLATVVREAMVARFREQMVIVDAEGKTADFDEVAALPELDLVTPGPEHAARSKPTPPPPPASTHAPS